MGRGRAKAKQTKVARELKYHTPGMDLDRLRKDLEVDPVTRTLSAGAPSDDDEAEPDVEEYSDDYDGPRAGAR